jgi:hypothetical protein
MDTAWIIVIVLGVLLVIVIVLACVLWFKYMKHQDKLEVRTGQDLTLTPEKYTESSESTYDHARWEALMKSIETEKS